MTTLQLISKKAFNPALSTTARHRHALISIELIANMIIERNARHNHELRKVKFENKTQQYTLEL